MRMVPPRRNFYILSTRRSNYKVFLEHMVYAADLRRPEHRALGNIKEGDLCLLYVMEDRSIYGVFEAVGRAFEGPRDLGLTGSWPHMVPLRVWGSHLGVIDRGRIAEFMAFLGKEVKTISDISELHRKYLNTLLHEEGLRLIQFFTRKCSYTVQPPRLPPSGVCR